MPRASRGGATVEDTKIRAAEKGLAAMKQARISEESPGRTKHFSWPVATERNQKQQQTPNDIAILFGTAAAEDPPCSRRPRGDPR